MDAVRCNPKDWTALESQRSTNGEEVIEGHRHAIRAMGVQAMVTHAYAKADGKPVQNGGNNDETPTSSEQSRDGRGVE
jgi:hypothetical protein